MTTNKKLRELASKAASGHWYEAEELCYHDYRAGELRNLHPDEDEYIAAVSPETVLALLDEIEALQTKCWKLAGVLELISDTDPDEGTAWFHDIAHKALAAHRKG